MKFLLRREGSRVGRVTYFRDFYPDVDDENVRCDAKIRIYVARLSAMIYSVNWYG